MQSPQTALTAIDIVNNYLLSFVPSLVDALLKILAAAIVFIIGWLIAMLIKLVLSYILNKINFKDLFGKLGLGKYMDDFGWEEGFDRVVAEIGFWVVLMIFLMTAFDILGLTIINSFIRSALSYLPKAISGGLILLFGFVFGELSRKAISGILRGLERKISQGVGIFVKWSIIVFSFLAALNQWGIAPDIINIIALGIVWFVALAGGLSFGLGGQELAREFLNNIRKHFNK